LQPFFALPSSNDFLMAVLQLINFRLFCSIVLSILIVPLVSASEHDLSETTGVDDEVVEYRADYFDRYRPNTALDIVRQIPGFQLDDGDSTRGFASSVGNLLINGRRPSTKEELISKTLARIPANQVERIELIHGQAEGIDRQGQSVLANVYLRTDIPASGRWQFWMMYNNTAPFKPGANLSISDRWREIDFNAGIDLERDTSGWYGTERVFDENGVLIVSSTDVSTEKGFRLNSLSLNASTWIGENFVQVNSKLHARKSSYLRPFGSVSQLPGGTASNVIIDTTTKDFQYELGADVERSLSNTLAGKLILLFINKDQDSTSSRENIDSILGRTLFRLADTDTAQKEGIARLEFDWSKFAEHALQFNVEWAYNVLDRGLIQTDDSGAGPVVVDVPGANSRVQEVRWDLLLQDTWSLGKLNMDLGIGAEMSTLSQTGDAVLERDFVYLKPHAILSYSSGRGKQTSFRVAREVSQLNLADFVTATVFQDDDLALGNPNIRPETTWVAEFSHERRFAQEKVIKLTVFYNWISDVLDLLPLSPDFEAPGNIGDGTRRGLQLDSTLSLDMLGLRNARVDIQMRWQYSDVTDPVTGQDRRLSGEGGQGGYRTLEVRNNNMKLLSRVDFRQDFARFAWGWTVADRSDRPLYKVNELDAHSEGTAVNAFIETTRWFGVKTRLVVENMLDFSRRRDRTLFVGERDLTAVDSTVINERHTGYRVSLFISGNF
jgi:hypothetical protein